MQLIDADRTERFKVGDMVSHNGGLIEAHTKRQITALLGYDPDGGARYRIALPGGADRGLAYDCELDPWPSEDVTLPVRSPRVQEDKPCR